MYVLISWKKLIIGVLIPSDLKGCDRVIIMYSITKKDGNLFTTFEF